MRGDRKSAQAGSAKWLAAIGMAGLLLAPLSAAAAAAAPVPSPGAGVPASSAAAPPRAEPGGTIQPPAAAPCTQARLDQLAPLLAAAPRESVIPANQILAGDANSDVTYVHPSGASEHLEFRAFLAFSAKDTLQIDPRNPRVLTVLRVDHPPAADAQSADLSGTDTQNAYQLHLRVPDRASSDARQFRTLVVIACAKTAAGPGGVAAVDRIVGYAVRPIVVSTTGGAALIAGTLVVLVYLTAATLVWAKRDSDAKNANKVEATPPTRVTQITPWRWIRCLDPVAMTSDMFDRASLSKLQIFFFILLVGFGATYSLVRTGTLSDLSSSIVYLLGIPALGALGNQVAGAARDRISLDNWAWLVNRGVFPLNDPGNDQPRWRDLVMSDAELDLYKLQALLFSIIVGAALITSGFSDLATFKVPDTLLQILGLSQVVFVGGRWTKATTLGDIDDLVSELRKRAAEVRVAAQSGIDVDASGKPLPTGTPGTPARGAPAATLAAAKTLVPNVVVRYEEIASEVELLLESLTHRDVQITQLKDPFRA